MRHTNTHREREKERQRRWFVERKRAIQCAEDKEGEEGETEYRATERGGAFIERERTKRQAYSVGKEEERDVDGEKSFENVRFIHCFGNTAQHLQMIGFKAL